MPFWPLQNCPWWPGALKALLPCWAVRNLPAKFWEKLQNQRGSGEMTCCWPVLMDSSGGHHSKDFTPFKKSAGEKWWSNFPKSAKAYSLRNGPSNPHTLLDYEIIFLPSFTHATNSYYDTNELLLPSRLPYWIQPKPVIALITEGNKWLLKVFWIRWHWESDRNQTHGTEELLLLAKDRKPKEKYF